MVLPDPFGPTTPMRSPGATVRETSSRSERVGNDLETEEADRTAGATKEVEDTTTPRERRLKQTTGTDGCPGSMVGLLVTWEAAYVKGNFWYNSDLSEEPDTLLMEVSWRS